LAPSVDDVDAHRAGRTGDGVHRLLEVDKRGIYAGCVGYFTANGDMDSCIILRTSIISGGKMYVQAGAGVVADSVPEKEHQECVAKARALFRAAEEAVRFASGVGRGQ
jgi:anthranilate synthase component 1